MAAQGIEEVFIAFVKQKFIFVNKVRKQVFNCANGLIPVEEMEFILGPYESQQLSNEDIIKAQKQSRITTNSWIRVFLT
jgi:hypothetical protein